jgi:hypothetical protein
MGLLMVETICLREIAKLGLAVKTNFAFGYRVDSIDIKKRTETLWICL